ncbi:MAG: hypothetical protein IPJ37_16895 [Bacteroidales bacterium]|nr:hypothetical protein [Bacteroidales bacterium]
MIARILAQDTGILVMDEPTAFLDIGSKFEILHLMHLLSQNSGKTIIFSTHDLNVAMSQADKIWLIIDDHLLEGAPEDLMLQGAFDHLFDSSAFQYNSEDGTYSFITENRGEINVSGEGIMLHLLPYLKLPSGSCRCWQLIESNSVTEFGSLYEFVNRIIDYPPSTT